MSAFLLLPSGLRQLKLSQRALAVAWLSIDVAPQGRGSHVSIVHSWSLTSLIISGSGSVTELRPQLLQLRATPLGQLLPPHRASLTSLVARSHTVSLAQADTSLYCPPTRRQPTSEDRLSEELKDLLLRFLAWPPGSAVFVPFFIVLTTASARIAATKRRWTEEDFAIGFDLLFTAVGSQLAALAAESKLNRTDVYVAADLELGFALLLGLLWLVVAMIIWIRLRGTDESHHLRPRQGVGYPIAVGFISLGLVYSLNIRLLAS